MTPPSLIHVQLGIQLAKTDDTATVEIIAAPPPTLTNLVRLVHVPLEALSWREYPCCTTQAMAQTDRHMVSNLL